jgi:magnesium-transporting ATPase (P-type)
VGQKDIEKDFDILGVTAMEDLLQDRVKDCIQDFRDAGIKVWMLTGDKGDTAHQIAFTCGLYSHD